MAITAKQVVDRVRPQLIDPDGTRWTDDEFMRWLGDAQKVILTAKPNAFSRTGVVSLVPGTKQKIPDDGYMLLSVVRNMSSDGVTPGRAVRIVMREVLDAFNPEWHAASKTAIVQNYVFDDRQFDIFHVYPPNDGTGKVELIYAKMPDEVTALDQILDVTDNYLVALSDYLMFRAHQKDSDYAAGQQVAIMYLNAFSQFVGVSTVAEASDDANQNLKGTMPGSKGGG